MSGFAFGPVALLSLSSSEDRPTDDKQRCPSSQCIRRKLGPE
jgi:hypothetical protein